MKLLIALDGSAPSLVARDLVAGMRWAPGTEATVLAAYQVPVDWTGGVGSTMDWVGEIEDATRDQLAADLEEWARPLVAAGLDVRREAVAGRAADVIVEAAARLGCDLIVTGSRGRGAVRSMLLGSVANEVVAHATVPVLVARAAHVGRLLVATDGSPAADAMAGRLSAWGVFAGHDADVLAVAVPDGPAFELVVGLSSLGAVDFEGQRREVAREAQQAAERLADRLRAAGIPAVPHVRRGDPAAEILAAADDANANLIITGSRGLGGLDRLLLGSVARNVLVHARCSVLIVRGPAIDSARQEA
jgi:nucleotide-binding universal stress UspA family protein